MDSGRTLGWSGQLDWPPASQTPPRGRHRKTGSSAGWTPAPRAEAETDPLVDTAPVGGLHKFDLGMVPASVTPPRSWRQAAWFAIASSAAALGGLVLVTSMLASSSTTIEGLDLPSMPRAGEYPPLLPDEERDRYFLTGDPTRPQAVLPTGSVLPVAPGDRPTGSGTTAPAPPPGEATGSAGPTPTTSAPRPPSTEVPPLLLAFTDPAEMEQRGGSYFAAIGRGDLPEAYAQTAGPLRDEGFEAFAARYAGVRTVEVVDVYVTPTSSVHTLRVTTTDGSVHTERHRLRYTRGDDPLITADERVS